MSRKKCSDPDSDSTCKLYISYSNYSIFESYILLVLTYFVSVNLFQNLNFFNNFEITFDIYFFFVIVHTTCVSVYIFKVGVGQLKISG